MLRVCSLIALTFFLASGCMDITGRGPAPLDHTIKAAEIASHTRVGHVYCMRGWLGIFSTGMDALAKKIDTEVGTPAVSVADEEWVRLAWWINDEYKQGKIGGEPLVLLGHSWGADDMIRVSDYLKDQGITIDLLVLIDPVTPPPVPSNVKRVYCVYKSHPETDAMPFWRGVPATVADPAATPLVNINLRDTDVGFDTDAIGHVNIEKNDHVHDMVMEEIKKTCPLRTVWLKSHADKTTVGQAPPAPAPHVTASPISAPRPIMATQ